MGNTQSSTAPPPSAPPAEAATYTVPDLACLLQCSERHIWRQLDMGRVPGLIRFGRLVRLSRRTIDAWLAAGCPADRRGARP
jgi:excisionase family DNA binding protein